MGKYASRDAVTFTGDADTLDGHHASYFAIAGGITWADVSGKPTIISIVPDPVDNQIAVWTDASTLEGTTGITYDGTDFIITGNIRASGEVSAFDGGTPIDWWDSLPAATYNTNSIYGGIILGSSNTKFLREDGTWQTISTVTDGDKGDITVSASGATWTIDNTVITYAKIQNVAANSFVANITGSSASLTEIATSRIPLFASAITGTPSASTFLRGDGSWAAGGGSQWTTSGSDIYFAGKVLIGLTGTPLSKLTVAQTVNTGNIEFRLGTNEVTNRDFIIRKNTTSPFDVNFIAGANTGSAGSSYHFYIGDYASSEALTILQSGYVGVSVTAPWLPLQISSGYAKTDTTERYITSFSSNEAVGSNPQQLVVSIIGNATNSSRTISLQTSEHGIANTGYLTLQKSGGYVGIGGNVLIGNTLNYGRAIISTSETKSNSTYTAATSALFLSTNETDTPFGVKFSVLGNATATSRYVSIQTGEHNVANNGNLLLQPSGGNVGIGTTAPYGLLQLGAGSFAATHSSYKEMHFGAGTLMFRDNFDSYISNNAQYITAGWVNKYSGYKSCVLAMQDGAFQFNIGTGTTAQSASSLATRMALDINGVAVTGTITATGEVTAYYLSDLTLKKNIKDFTALDILDNLCPKSFQWNEKAKELNSQKDDRVNYGLIAQEVEKILPELVHPIYEDYKAVDYIQLVPILLQAVKELKEEIKTLKSCQ